MALTRRSFVAGSAGLTFAFVVSRGRGGKLVAVACGPQSRQVQEVNSYILKMPDSVK